jgi:hypothetical protein
MLQNKASIQTKVLSRYCVVMRTCLMAMRIDPDAARFGSID